MLHLLFEAWVRLLTVGFFAFFLAACPSPTQAPPSSGAQAAVSLVAMASSPQTPGLRHREAQDEPARSEGTASSRARQLGDRLQALSNSRQLHIQTRCGTSADETGAAPWCDPETQDCPCGLRAVWQRAAREEGGSQEAAREACQVTPEGLSGACDSDLPYLNENTWFHFELTSVAPQDHFDAASCTVNTMHDADPRIKYYDQLVRTVCTGSLTHQQKAAAQGLDLPACPNSNLDNSQILTWITERQAAGDLTHTLVGLCGMDDTRDYEGNATENYDEGACTYAGDEGVISVLQLTYAAYFKERDERLSVRCPTETGWLEVEIAFPDSLPDASISQKGRAESASAASSSATEPVPTWDPAEVGACRTGLEAYEVRDDLDGDGYGMRVGGAPLNFCGQPHVYFSNQVAARPGEPEDCDDGDALQYPGAPERANGEDDSCDGRIDEGLGPTGGGCDVDGQADQDCDGYGLGEDCDDRVGAVHPDAAESEDCNGQDEDCDGLVDEGRGEVWTFDGDQDGHGADETRTQLSCEAPGASWTREPGGLDCNDQDGLTFPNADERCDGVDNDCDGRVDEGEACDPSQDLDGDGFSPEEGDCNDQAPRVHPEAEEVCNHADDDCDEVVDEDSSDPAGGLDCVDDDGDGWSEDLGDCDDENPGIYSDQDFQTSTINQAYTYDRDGDGFGSEEACYSPTPRSCTPPQGCVLRDVDAIDCDDGDLSVHPGATETCNGRDDDCDGTVDDGLTTYTYYADSDGDGYCGRGTRVSCSTTPPTGYVKSFDCNGGPGADCNDFESASNPGENYDYSGVKSCAFDVCKVVASSDSWSHEDNDCDFSIDEDGFLENCPNDCQSATPIPFRYSSP